MKEAANLADRHIERAHHLVQHFKKVSVGDLAAVRETVDLPALVRDGLELFRINARQSGLEINFDNQLAAGEATWQGYTGPLTQVLLNLLFNIERYAYPDGYGGVVEIELRADRRREPPVSSWWCGILAGASSLRIWSRSLRPFSPPAGAKAVRD